MTRDEAVQKAIVMLGYDGEENPEEQVAVDLCDGHSGHGWYAWPAEYPDEGSVRVDDGGVSRRAEGATGRAGVM